MRIIIPALLVLLFAFIACDGPSSTAEADEERKQEQSGVQPESEDPIAAWHQQRAREFSTIDDLAPILEKASDRRLILLGEASHGTREYYQWRAELSLALAAGPGLDFVALEADAHSVRAADQYVMGQGEADEVEDLLREHFDRWPQWMWANAEFAEFLRNARAHNQENPSRPLRIYGMDVFGFYNSIGQLNALADQYHPEQAPELAGHLNCLGQYGRDRESYARALHNRRHSHRGHDHQDSGESTCEAEIQRAFDLVMELFPENEYDHILARTHAHVVRAAEDQQRSRMLGGSPAIHWNARARPMYEITEEILTAKGDDARGAVWAHNTHLGDARASRMGDQDQVNIGQLSRESLGEDAVLSIGFSTYEGRVIAGSQWGAPLEIMEVPKGKEDSLDEILHRLGPSNHFLIFEMEDRELPFFQERPGQRAIGVVYNPARERFGNYVPTNPAARYDILIFLAETEELNPL